MAEDELPIVITAIADAQSEGFVASGLFAQGWSVVYRALDTTSLKKYLASNPDIAKSALLLYTPELQELNPASCFELSGMVKQSIGFSNDLEKYKSNNTVERYNHFIAHFKTKGNMKLLADSFQRKLLINDFKKWMMLNIRFFI